MQTKYAQYIGYLIPVYLTNVCCKWNENEFRWMIKIGEKSLIFWFKFKSSEYQIRPNVSKDNEFFSSSRLWIWFLELFHFDCSFSLVNLSIHWCFVFLLLVLNNFQFLATFRSFHRISAQYLFNVSSSTHSFSSHYEFWTSFPLLLILNSNCQQFFFSVAFFIRRYICLCRARHFHLIIFTKCSHCIQSQLINVCMHCTTCSHIHFNQ